jgi:aspartyl-tRNA synthetase
MTQSRTHTCGELRLQDAGKTVTLCGWMENIREVGNGFAFVVLRDYYGTTQIVLENDEENLALVKSLNKESTLQVTGRVQERASKNPKLPTGEIEVVPTEIRVLGRCRYNELPFEINRSREADEQARLKYRYLDLRNPAVKKNVILRSQVTYAMRQAMVEHGFLEISTPILTASSPEGARDYLVPARKHPGKFYALPQAPQQFKQLLMTAGFDRYFQIAPCFRDEDAGATGPPASFTSWIWRWPLPPRTTCWRCWRTCWCPFLRNTACTTGSPPPPSGGSPTTRPWRSTARTSPTCA